MASEMSTATAVETSTPSTPIKLERDERKGFRRSLRKWKDKLKSQKKLSPSRSPSLIQRQREPSLQRNPSVSPPTPPENPFAPTTQTVISSPLDRRNSRASPPSAFNPRPRNSRRNTAPADYFSNQPASSRSVSAPLNTITTTITANTPPKKGLRSRLSVSLSKRVSTQEPVNPISLTPTPPAVISPAPSAPNPVDHPNRRATFQFTTAAEIAAQTKLDEGKLKAAAEVIRRDKPKDWMDPGWREKEEREVEKLKKVMEEEGNEVGDVRLRGSHDGDGPLKKWEWGR